MDWRKSVWCCIDYAENICDDENHCHEAVPCEEFEESDQMWYFLNNFDFLISNLSSFCIQVQGMFLVQQFVVRHGKKSPKIIIHSNVPIHDATDIESINVHIPPPVFVSNKIIHVMSPKTTFPMSRYPWSPKRYDLSKLMLQDIPVMFYVCSSLHRTVVDVWGIYKMWCVIKFLVIYRFKL